MSGSNIKNCQKSWILFAFQQMTASRSYFIQFSVHGNFVPLIRWNQQRKRHFYRQIHTGQPWVRQMQVGFPVTRLSLAMSLFTYALTLKINSMLFPTYGQWLLSENIAEHSPGEQCQIEACENVQLSELSPYEQSQDLVESKSKRW